jgi:hypothetical protein
LWLERARHSEIEITLTHLARLRGRYETARRWLEERLLQVERGQAPSYDLEAYAEAAGTYEVLGQGFWRRMRELGVE